jgi:hypothetical protein
VLTASNKKSDMSKRRRGPDEENVDPAGAPPLLPQSCGCARAPRVGWNEADYLSQPLGVWDVVKFECGHQVGCRRHALFGARSADEPWSFLGCYETDGGAASAWDAESRRRGFGLANAPANGERSVAEALLERVHRIEGSGPDSGFPYASEDPAWRNYQMRKLLDDVAAGALSDVWSPKSGGRELQQHDHWRAPGCLLCYSFNPHIFQTRKARSCGPMWMEDTQPRLSAVEWWEVARGK